MLGKELIMKGDMEPVMDCKAFCRMRSSRIWACAVGLSCGWYMPMGDAAEVAGKFCPRKA